MIFARCRFDYGEPRFQTYGLLAGRLMQVVWTPRGEARHVISMRKCNDREKRKIAIDWAKVDAHKIAPEDYAEMPEWTDDQIERAELAVGSRMSPGNIVSGTALACEFFIFGYPSPP